MGESDGCSVPVRVDRHGFAVYAEGSVSEEENKCQACAGAPGRSNQDESRRLESWVKLLADWEVPTHRRKAKVSYFLRSGVPWEIRGTLWKKLLEVDTLKQSVTFNYKVEVAGLRNQLVDLNVCEYNTQEALSILSEYSDARHSGGHVSLDCLRQILLDVDRCYPSHDMYRSGTNRGKEGRASLFRVLALYAKYNPTVGYCQGMSYVAGLLLMQMEEEGAFWCLLALLERNKYLAGYFNHCMDRIQRHSAIFQQLLRQRYPQVAKNARHLGLNSLMYIVPWFVCVFTSMPCWDAVLAIWDLYLLEGVCVLFRVGLAIVGHLEHDILQATDISTLLPMLLHLPTERVCHDVLMKVVWETSVEDWEITQLENWVAQSFKTGRKRQHDTPDFPLFHDPLDLIPSPKRRKVTQLKKNKSKGQLSLFQRFINIFTPREQREDGTSEESGPNNNAESPMQMSVASPRRSQVATRMSISPYVTPCGSRRIATRSQTGPAGSVSKVKVTSPCGESMDYSSIGLENVGAKLRLAGRPVRRSPRIIQQRALKGINVPSNNRLLTSSPAVQYSFKSFNTPAPLRHNQRKPATPGSAGCMSPFSSPEVELHSLDTG